MTVELRVEDELVSHHVKKRNLGEILEHRAVKIKKRKKEKRPYEPMENSIRADALSMVSLIVIN